MSFLKVNLKSKGELRRSGPHLVQSTLEIFL